MRVTGVLLEDFTSLPCDRLLECKAFDFLQMFLLRLEAMIYVSGQRQEHAFPYLFPVSKRSIIYSPREL